MRAKKLFGKTVLDKNVKEVGKIDDVEIETGAGKIVSIVVSLKKGILSNDEIEIDFGNIATIGDYVLLDNVIETAEKVEEVEIEVEDE